MPPFSFCIEPHKLCSGPAWPLESRAWVETCLSPGFAGRRPLPEDGSNSPGSGAFISCKHPSPSAQPADPSGGCIRISKCLYLCLKVEHCMHLHLKKSLLQKLFPGFGEKNQEKELPRLVFFLIPQHGPRALGWCSQADSISGRKLESCLTTGELLFLAQRDILAL